MNVTDKAYMDLLILTLTLDFVKELLPADDICISFQCMLEMSVA